MSPLTQGQEQLSAGSLDPEPRRGTLEPTLPDLLAFCAKVNSPGPWSSHVQGHILSSLLPLLVEGKPSNKQTKNMPLVSLKNKGELSLYILWNDDQQMKTEIPNSHTS